MNTEIEIWKDVPGYEGLYQASSFGLVKSLGNKYSKKIKILKGRPDGNGYSKIALFKNTVRKDYRIHKIIAITFLNHTPCGMKYVVDHIDNNKENNKISNLQIITNRENCSKGWIGKKSSKYTGVYKSKNKWVANITHNYNCKSLGVFSSEFEAHKSYQKALSKINEKSKKCAKSITDSI